MDTETQVDTCYTFDSVSDSCGIAMRQSFPVLETFFFMLSIQNSNLYVIKILKFIQKYSIISHHKFWPVFTLFNHRYVRLKRHVPCEIVTFNNAKWTVFPFMVSWSLSTHINILSCICINICSNNLKSCVYIVQSLLSFDQLFQHSLHAYTSIIPVFATHVSSFRCLSVEVFSFAIL